MGVDQILEIDLSNLTVEGLDLIDEQFGKIEDQLKKAGKKPAQKKKLTQAEREKETKEKKTKKEEKEKQKQKKIQEQEKKQDKQTKDFVKKTAQNPGAFVISTLKTTIPQLSAVLLITGVIQNILKRINDIQTKFTENVDERINIALSNQEQARVDANLQQIIITSGDGSANPRNVYNSFNESDTNISFIESNYILDNTSGYN